jgi:type IV pilus assembly protein PilE
MKHNQSIIGFTLIELMMVVLISSIITAIAIPSYRQYVISARIPEATSQLTFYRFKMEQYYQDNQTYGINSVCGIALTNTVNFNYTCVTPSDGQSYVITAQGNNVNSMTAFTYTINEAGKATTTALPPSWGAVPRDCWIVKANKGCTQ